MSEAYKAKQDYPKSIELLDQLISKYPDSAATYMYRGYAHMMNGSYDKALADYKRLIVFILQLIRYPASSGRFLRWVRMTKALQPVKKF